MRISSYAARIAAVTLAAAMVTGCGTARHAPQVWQATGQQPTCRAAQLGSTHLFRIGHGPVFRARCDHDGPIDVWDAR